jgi:hypothetical protein
MLLLFTLLTKLVKMYAKVNLLKHIVIRITQGKKVKLSL